MRRNAFINATRHLTRISDCFATDDKLLRAAMPITSKCYTSVTTRFTRITLASMVLLGGLAGGAAPANGAAMHLMKPGTECVEHTDTSPEIYYLSGTAANDAGGTNTFVCPVSYTNYLSLDGLGDFLFDRVQWHVLVDDRHPTSNVSCYLRSCNEAGTSCRNSPTRQSSNTGYHTLSMTSTFQLGSGYRHVHLRCDVPGKYNNARSAIRGYRVTTFD